MIEEFKDDKKVIVGAGTVMNLDHAALAKAAGAKFLVSPHFSPEIAKFAVENDIEYSPGCGTVTEVVNATAAGAKIVKLFPGGTIGKGFIQAIHGPIPEVNLMPSGGVSASNVHFEKVELDHENGILVYEVDFKSGNIEYDYDINASTGAIVSFSSEEDD